MLQGHLASETVKRVIVTAPSANVPMVVIGVNDQKIEIGKHSKILFTCDSAAKPITYNFVFLFACIIRKKLLKPRLDQRLLKSSAT